MDETVSELIRKHGGFAVRRKLLDARGDRTQVEMASKLGDMSQMEYSQLENAKRPIRGKHALLLEAAGFGAAEFWMTLQAMVDLAQTRAVLKNG